MIESNAREWVVAVVKPCEQYRFQVEPPLELDKATRVEMRSRALSEANATFLECSRNYQAVGWVGIANVAFADTRTSPSDSKSEFLHSLISMKLIELCVSRFQADSEAGDGARPVLLIEAALTWTTRRLLEKLCEELGIGMRHEAPAASGLLPRPKIGGAYRPRREGGGAFVLWPIKRIEDFRSGVLRRLSGRRLMKKPFNRLMQIIILLLWPLPIVARVVFSMIYQMMAVSLLKKLDGPKNVFVYFDLRLGKNRDVASYLRWKFGDLSEASPGATLIPFSHLARPGQAYSFAAMRWAFGSLRKMGSRPLEGCVVVNYMIPPWLLLKVQFRRCAQRRTKRKRLRELHRQAPDFLASHIYEEFILALDQCNAFPIELSRCYKRFFDTLTPGVVIQADAASKTARHFTACARHRGGRVVYVADRICTSLRTSNQLISHEGDNPQIPDRCVVFDQVSRDEFIRQGMAGNSIHTYHRNFAVGRESGTVGKAGRSQVVILLQAYEDNIGAMVRVGTEIISKMKGVDVIYQEHPNFPLCVRMRARLRASHPKRLRFLDPGEPLDYQRTLALVTGYSTAAVPGVLQGVPLIWLRGQIDNSVFGAAYLDRIGFAADKSAEVISLLKRLRRKEPRMLRACGLAGEAAREIFIPACGPAGTALTDALRTAVEDSFGEIAAAAANREAAAVHGVLEPANA
jgi:hypothetical protein